MDGIQRCIRNKAKKTENIKRVTERKKSGTPLDLYHNKG